MLITSDDDWNTIWAPPPPPKAPPRHAWLKALAQRAGRTAVFAALVGMVLMGAFFAGLGVALIVHHP